jgi:hypothetical protein
LSPDDVILSAGAGSGANMILFWDTGTIPTGWTDVSATGQAFNNRFPRGADTYGGIGGTGGTHSHTVSLVSIGPPSPTTQVRSGATNRASNTHTHALASGSTGTVSNLPSYKNLRVIKYNSGVPTVIPSGAMAIFDTTLPALPAGWTQYAAQNNYFVQGSGTTGGTGGTDTDSHTVPNLAATSNYRAVTATGTTIGGTGHTHTLSNTTSIDKRPPYITVILAKANADTAIPVGMIAMFDDIDDSLTGDWSVLSGTGGPFDSRFIVGSATTYGTIGGASSHQPTGPSTSSNSSGGQSASIATPTVLVASQPHTHSVTLSFNSVSNLPPYRDVIFAKALYASSGTIASQVLPTATGSRWDALFWDESLATGTDITFEVRASDESFAKDASDVSYPWTSIGGTSPVLTGLPSGQYKQWRATLTSNGSQTNTPTLQEVRVFYYGG